MDRLYDPLTLKPIVDIDVEQLLEANRLLETEKENLLKEIEQLKNKLSSKILLVEDGSVDIDKLEEDGFYCIVYRSGSNPPQWLNRGDNENE